VRSARAVDGGEEPAGGSPRRARPSELAGEGSGHADAVLVHGEPLVAVGGRERPAGEQVVLVGGEGDTAPEHGGEVRLGGLHGVDHRRRLLGGVGAHPCLAVEAAHSERDDAHRGEIRVLVEDARERVDEDVSVVHTGADHHLPVDLDTGIEQCA
jgi:hypothetical protein